MRGQWRKRKLAPRATLKVKGELAVALGLTMILKWHWMGPRHKIAISMSSWCHTPLEIHQSLTHKYLQDVEPELGISCVFFWNSICNDIFWFLDPWDDLSIPWSSKCSRCFAGRSAGEKRKQQIESLSAAHFSRFDVEWFHKISSQPCHSYVKYILRRYQKTLKLWKPSSNHPPVFIGCWSFTLYCIESASVFFGWTYKGDHIEEENT